MAKADDGHGVCIGDWCAAHARSARAGIHNASLHDVKWTLKLIQPILIQMVHDLWDTRTAILTGVPIPGTRPRLRRQRFYAVAEGDNKGVYESYAEVQLRHSKAVSFPSHSEAQAFMDGYQVPVRVDLSQCTAPDLVVFTDGSCTPSGAKPATSGWGFVVQSSDEETAIHERSGPLIAPDKVRHEGQLKQSI